MSVISKPWKLYNTIKNIVKDSKPTGKVIKKVKPNVPTTRLEKASRDLILAKQKTKGSTAKLKQTQFEIDQANKGKGDYNFTFDPLKANVKKKSKLRENKMGGGMMGRRMGLKAGSNGSKKGKELEKKAKGGRVGLKTGTNPFKKKSNVDKIKETFGPKKRVNAKKGFPDLSGDGKTTFKDILIGRGVIKKGKKNKKPMMAKKSETPMDKAVKKDKKKKRII